MILELPKRVTLKDIAGHARLSVAAVSMALRNHVSLPSTTIDRVKKIADELGYRPDPALCALAAHRSRVRPSQSVSVIALVSNWTSREGWLELPGMRQLYAGAKARANALGFDLQHFWAREHGGFGKRLSDVLEARGIKSVVLAPATETEAANQQEWDKFTVVSLEPPPLDLRVPHVGVNHYANVVRCWRELTARGFCRVGLVTNKHQFGPGAGQSIAAHSFTQSCTASPFDQVPVLTLEAGHEKAQILAWLQTHRPEAVIGCTPHFFRITAETGLQAPRDFNYVSLDVENDVAGVSGINCNLEVVGQTVVDTLNQLIQRGITCAQSHAMGTHVEGHWHEGTTLVPRCKLTKIG